VGNILGRRLSKPISRAFILSSTTTTGVSIGRPMMYSLPPRVTSWEGGRGGGREGGKEGGMRNACLLARGDAEDKEIFSGWIAAMSAAPFTIRLTKLRRL
jgi:hypothetical protein